MKRPDNALPSQPDPVQTRRLLFWITAGSILIRLVFVIFFSRFTKNELLDSDRYVNVALNLLAGNGFSEWGNHRTAFVPPAYPLFLAGCFGLFGVHEMLVRIIQAVLGGLLPLVVFGMGRRLGDDRTALTASAITALYPELVVLTGYLYTETFFILLACLTFLFLLYSFFAPPYWQIAVAIIVLASEVGLWFMLRQRQVQLVGVILTFLLWSAIFAEVIIYGGIRDTGFAAFAIVITIASLTMGNRASLGFTALTILAGAGLAAAESRGLLPVRQEVAVSSTLLSYTITFLAIVALLYLSIRSLTNAAQKAIEDDQLQLEINRQLEESRAQLQERTTALEHRTLSLQAAADLVHLSSQATNETSLLDQVAKLIAERLGYTHVGIFITESTGEYAILRASNSEAGQSLLADHYQLRIARGELVYIVSGTELLRYRIGGHIYRIASPMPITGVQGNISFPLISSNRLMGLLNIQTHASAPPSEEQAILQSFADQLAISIQNLRLVSQLQERVHEISALAGETVRKAWEEVGGGTTIGYQYDRLQLLPSGEELPADIIDQLNSGRSIAYTTSGAKPRSRIIVPLILREQLIGILGYDDEDPSREWQPDEKILLETIATQVSLTLENSRLVAEARQRAEREQAVSEIVGNISTQIDMDTILQATVKEISRLVGESEVAIQLHPAEKKQ